MWCSSKREPNMMFLIQLLLLYITLPAGIITGIRNPKRRKTSLPSFSRMSSMFSIQLKKQITTDAALFPSSSCSPVYHSQFIYILRDAPGWYIVQLGVWRTAAACADLVEAAANGVIPPLITAINFRWRCIPLPIPLTEPWAGRKRLLYECLSEGNRIDSRKASILIPLHPWYQFRTRQCGYDQ